jgi:hypothetical protein
LLTDKFEVLQQTYPIAVGKKGRDHSEVIIAIFQEMKKLFSGPFSVMYSTGNRFPAYIHSEVIAVMSDQLERWSNLKLGAGNHRYHRRFGYSCNMESVLQYVHACPSCVLMNKNISKEVIESDTVSAASIGLQKDKCLTCTNWFSHDNSPLLRYKPDPDFPKSRLINEKYIKAHKLSFDSLLEAIQYVHHGIVDMSLTKSKVVSYLRYYCFSNDTVDQIYDCANNCLVLKTVTSLHDNNEDPDNDYEKIIANKEKFPHLYEMYRLPEFMYHSYMNLDVFGEAPMHNLFPWYFEDNIH